MLTKFWGRAITMRAGVVLPPGYGKDPKKTYAGVYHVHGFGGDHTAHGDRSQLVREMGEGKGAEMITSIWTARSRPAITNSPIRSTTAPGERR